MIDLSSRTFIFAGIGVLILAGMSLLGGYFLMLTLGIVHRYVEAWPAIGLFDATGIAIGVLGLRATLFASAEALR